MALSRCEKLGYTPARHKWLCVQHESLERQYSVKQSLFPHITCLIGLHSAVRDGLAHKLGTLLEKNWSMYWLLHLFARGDWKCTFYFRVKNKSFPIQYACGPTEEFKGTVFLSFTLNRKVIEDTFYPSSMWDLKVMIGRLNLVRYEFEASVYT